MAPSPESLLLTETTWSPQQYKCQRRLAGHLYRACLIGYWWYFLSLQQLFMDGDEMNDGFQLPCIWLTLLSGLLGAAWSCEQKHDCCWLVKRGSWGCNADGIHQSKTPEVCPQISCAIMQQRNVQLYKFYHVRGKMIGIFELSPKIP